MGIALYIIAILGLALNDFSAYLHFHHIIDIQGMVGTYILSVLLLIVHEATFEATPLHSFYELSQLLGLIAFFILAIAHLAKIEKQMYHRKGHTRTTKY